MEETIKEEKNIREAGETGNQGGAVPEGSDFVRVVDDMVRKYFPKPRFLGKTSIEELGSNLCPQFFQTLSEYPKRWPSLSKMVTYLDKRSRFSFWRAIFANRKYVPPEELLKIWYGVLDDRGSLFYQIIQTQSGNETYFTKVSHPVMQTGSVITDPLLIDDPIVSMRYCQVQKPGWELLQYIHGRRHQTLPMSGEMREALQTDNMPAFGMFLDITDRHVPFSLLAEVIDNGAAEILRYLLEEKRVAKDAITMPELCCYLTARFPDPTSVPCLGVIDELYPGTIQAFRDIFGRNLLWYAMQNMRTAWFHPDNKLVPFLLEHGCDPQNKNQIGLTWQAARDGLDMRQMVSMLRRRHQLDFYKRNRHYRLQDDQPMCRLFPPKDTPQTQKESV